MSIVVGQRAHIPITMQRLSRAESQARTRTALLDAARAALVKTGAGAASVDRIAEQAGYSKGAFYSNFDSRESLLLELLARHLDSEVSALTELLQANGSLEELLGQVKTFYAAMHADPSMVIVSVEFQLLAFRHDKVRDAYAALWAGHRAALARLLTQAADRLDLRLRTPAPSLIDALAGLTRGLVLQRAASGAAGAVTATVSVEDALVHFLRGELLPRSP